MNPPAARRGLILAAVCLAAFAINVDTTIVNVALPSLTRQLGAGTRDLQWIVDGYNLAFAALVLSAGSLGDRFGRRPALIVGLLGFAAASAAAALCSSPGQLVAARFVMGAFAALIFPTTLAVISNTFSERSERAKAVGVWGAVTGLGVAIGPVTGGLLLSAFSWPSVFVALVPVALLAAAVVWRVVPESREANAAPLDFAGLLTATLSVGTLVYTIIEAPGRGWGSPASVAGFAAVVLVGGAFVQIERRREHPMLDVRLFGERAFSAASGAVTVAFFALFGFIFLITQYFQFIRGYGTLSTGARILPVALSIGAASVLGARLASRLGTRAIVICGLLLFGGAFLWIAEGGTATPYPVIVVQMLLMGSGLGLTSAPATESILSVLSPAKAGVGSAVNDATREAGGTLGVAIIGSVYASLYASHLSHGAAAHLPAAALASAKSSVGAALAVAARAPAAVHGPVLDAVQKAFMSGLHAGCFVAAGVCALGAVGAVALPGRRRPTARVASRSALPAGAVIPDPRQL
ncbi:MAG TPA: MFS transporter [Solirubrobacteraceae bacterium]|jgi:EmrB/QacA subfamily drug resistance transporter